LEKEGIKTNLTLVFTLAQAVKCAVDGITLISPFVGRINDGYSKKFNKTYLPHEEPGIHAVKEIYNYLKKYDYKTIIMVNKKI
jgi:transaldolase